MKERIFRLLSAARAAVIDFFKYDRVFKLISLAAAIALWLFMGAQNPETSRTFRDIEIDILTNMTGDSALSLIYAQDNQASVTASAKRTALLDVSVLDFDLSVDATDIKAPGIYTLAINASTRASDITIDRVTPSKTEVRLDYLVTKTFPIELKIDNKLGSGYVLGEQELSADSVTVTGPKTELDQVKEVYALLRVDEAGRVEEQLSLRYADGRGENVDTTYFRTDFSKVGVKMNVYTQKTVELYADVDCTDSVFDRDMFDVTVSPSQVEIYGLEEDIRELDRVSIGTFKSGELESGSFKHRVSLPEGVYSASELTVTATVNMKSLRDQEIKVSDIRFENLSEEYDAEADSSAVTITVRSDQTLTGDELYLVLDMSNLGVGTHEVTPALALKNGVKADLMKVPELRVVVTVK